MAIPGEEDSDLELDDDDNDEPEDEEPQDWQDDEGLDDDIQLPEQPEDPERSAPFLVRTRHRMRARPSRPSDS